MYISNKQHIRKMTASSNPLDLFSHFSVGIEAYGKLVSADIWCSKNSRSR